MLNANKRDLVKVKGLGPAKIAQLLAATEIAKRQLKEQIERKASIHGPEDLIEYLSISMANRKEEVFKVVYLNSANKILSVEDLFKGTVDQSVVYPREVIKRAFELNASGLIFVHNHPSGDLKPSKDDLSLNRKLIDACHAVNLNPLDHIIISSSGYISLRDKS